MAEGSQQHPTFPEIIIADGQPLLRDGLRLLLERMDRGMRILDVGDMRELRQLLNAPRRLRLLFYDLALPDADGFAGLAEVFALTPTAPVIAMSASEARGDIAQAVNLGARGYVLKSSAREVLRLAIALVLAGETYVPANAFAAASNDGTQPAPASLLASRDNPVEQLTARQLEVLRHVIDGQSNKLIARELGVNETTVKSHLKAVMRRLGASNRTQAARTALQLGCRPESASLQADAAD